MHCFQDYLGYYDYSLDSFVLQIGSKMVNNLIGLLAEYIIGILVELVVQTIAAHTIITEAVD